MLPGTDDPRLGASDPRALGRGDKRQTWVSPELSSLDSLAVCTDTGPGTAFLNKPSLTTRTVSVALFVLHIISLDVFC